jgi:hypothetical protein
MERKYVRPSIDIIWVLQAKLCVCGSKRRIGEVAKEPKSASWIETDIAASES